VADAAEVAAARTAVEGAVAAHIAEAAEAAGRTAAAEARIAAVAGRIAGAAAAAMDSAAFAAEEAWAGPPRLVSPFRRRTDIRFARAEHRARIGGKSS